MYTRSFGVTFICIFLFSIFSDRVFSTAREERKVSKVDISVVKEHYMDDDDFDAIILTFSRFDEILCRLKYTENLSTLTYYTGDIDTVYVYLDHEITSIMQYRDGMYHGYSYTFYNERKRTERHYIHGIKHGVSRTWHFNGRLAAMSHWYRDNLNGSLEEWTQDGRLATYLEYTHGKLGKLTI